MKKKFLFLLAAAFSVAAVFSSCGDPEGDDDKNKSNEVYTAETQKTKLQDIAIELMSKFNTEDQRQAVALSDYLTHLYEDYDWDFSAVEDHYKGDYGFLYSVNRDVRRVVYGDVTANFATDLLAKATKSGAPEIYKFSNIDAVWEANETEHRWEYKGKGNGGLVLKFKGPKGVQCEAKLWGEDGTVTYKGTYEVPNGKYYIRLNERTVTIPYEEGKKYYETQIWSKGYEYEGEKYYVYYSDESDSYTIDAFDKHYVTEEDYENGWCEYEGEKYWIIYEDYDDQPFEATLPNKVNFYLKEGAAEHIASEIEFDVKKNDHFNYKSTIKVTNITMVQALKASKKTSAFAFGLKYGNEELIKTAVDLSGSNFPDMNDGQDLETWLNMCYRKFIDDYTLQIGSAVAQVDILGGKLTIKTSTTNGMKFWKDYDALCDKYREEYNGDGSVWYDETEPFNTELASLMNHFLKTDLYYGDSKAVQAQMKWEASYRDEEVEVWNSATSSYDYKIVQLWDCDPMIYFPSDQTSYNFGKYFTESRFNTVINTAEEFVKKYIRLSERWGDYADDIDF